MKTIVFAIVGAVLLAVSSASAESLNVQPGQWNITRTYVRGPGKTAPDPGGVRIRCITKESLARPEVTFDNAIMMMSLGVVTGSSATPAPVMCGYIDVKETANSINFTYRCTGGYAFAREGAVVFDSPTHFRGHFVVQVTQGGLRPTIPEMTTEGTRVGDCVKTSQH